MMTDVFVFARIHYTGMSQIIEAYSKTYKHKNMFKVFLFLHCILQYQLTYQFSLTETRPQPTNNSFMVFVCYATLSLNVNNAQNDPKNLK